MNILWVLPARYHQKRKERDKFQNNEQETHWNHWNDSKEWVLRDVTCQTHKSTCGSYNNQYYLCVLFPILQENLYFLKQESLVGAGVGSYVARARGTTVAPGYP